MSYLNIAARTTTAFIILTLTSCVASGPQISGQSRHTDVFEAFTSGDIFFDCFFACSGRWGNNREEIKHLYNAGRWRELALRVMDIGIEWDISYYYLGRAAEELGYPAAAKNYYLLSLSAKKCDAGFNICEGFEFPAASTARLAGLENRPSSFNVANTSAPTAKLSANSQATSVPAEFPPSNILKSSDLPERRISLVIGNSRYRNLPRLDNPRNDAELIATTLNKLGFTVIGGKALIDLDKTNLENAVKAFSEALQQGDSASRFDNSVGLGNRKNDGRTSSVVALFYYAGHGIQARGENYLIPVDANPTKESDFDFQLTNVNLVLRQMESAATALNMVILDACRNNPIGGRGLRSSGNGLAEMKAPEGTIIAFATQSGNVAQDGPSGGNSPFAQALAWGIQQPGLDQFGAFNSVAVRVKKITAGAQQPWMSNSPIEGQFLFVPK